MIKGLFNFKRQSTIKTFICGTVLAKIPKAMGIKTCYNRKRNFTAIKKVSEKIAIKLFIALCER